MLTSLYIFLCWDHGFVEMMKPLLEYLEVILWWNQHFTEGWAEKIRPAVMTSAFIPYFTILNQYKLT